MPCQQYYHRFLTATVSAQAGEAYMQRTQSMGCLQYSPENMPYLTLILCALVRSSVRSR